MEKTERMEDSLELSYPPARSAYYLGRRLYFQPHIEFSSITDRRLREQLAPANIVNFGIAFGFSK